MADPIYANPLIDPQIDVNNLNTIYSSEYITQNYNTFFNQNTESERLDYMPVGYENQESFDPLETSYGLDFKSSLEAQGFVNYIQNNPVRRTATTSGPTVTAEGTILTPQQIKQRSVGPSEQRVVRQGEALPFYTGQEETGKSVFDFWKDIPNISSFSEGLRGTVYGISGPVSDQPEPAAAPVQQQQQQRQTGRSLFQPGGHPGTSGTYASNIKSGFMDINPETGKIGFGPTANAATVDALGLSGLPQSFGEPQFGSTVDTSVTVDLSGKAPGGDGGDGSGNGVSMGHSGRSGRCFVAGTMMTMGNGDKVKVENIKLLDEILAANGKINKVIEVYQSLVGQRKVVSINGSKFFCTEDHPFKTKNGWQAVNSTMSTELYPNLDILNTDLAIGDTVETEDGDIIVEKIDTKEVPVDTHIWNFLMSGDHTYVAEGFVMHNKFCFTPDTPVLLSNGKTKPIDKITIGTEIFGFNDQGQLLPTDVVDIETRDIYNYIVIKTDTRKVSTTDEHPFYIGEGKYKRADSLQVNDTIYTQEGQELIPETITNILPIIKPSTVYCLHLEGEVKTYFAGGFAVHSSNTTLLGLDGESFTEENLENYFVKHNNDVISEASVI